MLSFPSSSAFSLSAAVQADFVSRGMWEGAIAKGFSKQELNILRAPLVYAEIMSFIKVRRGCGGGAGL